MKLQELEKNTITKHQSSLGYVYAEDLDEYIYLGTIDTLEVYLRKNWSGNFSGVTIVQPQKSPPYEIAGVIEFKPINVRKRYFSTYDTVIKSKYQGNALGYRVYLLLLQNGFTLVSGTSQSPGARKLWAKLVENPNVFAWVQVPGSRKKYPVFVNDDGEVDSSLGVYSDEEEINDEDSSRYRSLANQFEDLLGRLNAIDDKNHLSPEVYDKHRAEIEKWYRKEKRKIDTDTRKEQQLNKKIEKHRIYIMWQG